MILEIVVGLALASIILYWWMTRDYDYWSKQSVPSLTPSWPFGNVRDLFLMKKNSADQYDVFYKAFPDEPFVGFFRLRTPHLLLKDSDLIKTVLVKEFNSFSSTGFQMTTDIDPIIGLNPFAAEGNEWKRIRTLHSHVLTTAKLKLMVPLISQVCEDMTLYLKDNQGVAIEAKYFAGQFTVDVVTSCIFGIQTNSFKTPDAEFRRKADEMFQPSRLFNFVQLLIFSEPWLIKLFRLRFFRKDLADYFAGVVENIIRFRRQNNISRNDFLQLLISSGETGIENLNYEEIAGHCMTFFLDGYETTSIVLGYVLYMLGSHKDVQDKLRKSLFDSKLTEDNLDYDKIHSLTYLDWVVKETLRMSPPVGMLSRACTKETSLKIGDRSVNLKKGTLISVPIVSLHRDPNNFQEPMKFNPDRFEANPNPPLFFPFGAGPRICMGPKFAMTQMKLFLFHLLRKYSVSVVDTSLNPFHYNPYSSVLCISKSGLMVKFSKLKL